MIPENLRASMLHMNLETFPTLGGRRIGLKRSDVSGTDSYCLFSITCVYRYLRIPQTKA